MTTACKAHQGDECCGMCGWHRDEQPPTHDVHCILLGEEKGDTETCKRFVKQCRTIAIELTDEFDGGEA